MKVLPFEIPKPEKSSLIYQEDVEFVFYDQLHQHKEIQLSFIKEGEGTLVVGDMISHYQKGDVLAIGPNLPHVFKSDKNVKKQSEMLTLFFTKNSFGEFFFSLDELKELKEFFLHIENGFKVISHKKQLENCFLQLKEASKLNRFVMLLTILKLMAKAKKQELSSFVYEKKYSKNEGKRMQEIMDYTMNHSSDFISLELIASVASMTKNAFCKYFKKRTNKTYFQFLNELRVENASKLLISKKDVSIAEIAYECGFTNLSNFNRQFKAVKKKTPSVFRKSS